MNLIGIENQLRDYVATVDVDCLAGADAAAGLKAAVRIKNMARTLETHLARRVARLNAARPGSRSEAEGVAAETGSSVGQAREQLRTADALAEHADLDSAARSGRLSPQMTDVIAGAADAAPDAVQNLLGLVEQGASLGEVRDAAARLRASADPDPEERRRRIHASRFCRSWTDAEGAGNLRMRDNPEVIAQIQARIDSVVDELFATARREGRPEPREAYCADALTRLVSGEAAVARPRTKIIFRVDLPAWLRGWPEADEVMELSGYGPVAASVIDEAIAAGGLIAGIFTRGERLIGVAHLSRPPTAKQQSALEWIYPSCAVMGCSAKARLQRDHRVDWADSRVTMLDWLDLLCAHHHGLKTTANWQLVEGRGKRAFVPPDDSRHPWRVSDARSNAPPRAAAL